MNAEVIERKFLRMGARLKISRQEKRRSAPLTLDVTKDSEGEHFLILATPGTDADLEVVDVQRDDRHLLLMTRENGRKHKFLCGHDERHWFVAAIPERARGVTNVATAMEALKPEEVLRAQDGVLRRPRDRKSRRNRAYVRQGEWFFVPEPAREIDPALILRNEPLSRGRRSKPHVMEECYRTGGELVYVSYRYPNGVNQATYNDLMRNDRTRARRMDWWTQRRDPEVYARGTVRHADHRTIRLTCWHRVFMNTEHQAAAMSQIVFLD
jgi:hypothetical protein